jgi:hypothetical protein
MKGGYPKRIRARRIARRIDSRVVGRVRQGVLRTAKRPKKVDRNAARETVEREQKKLAAKRSKISMSLEAILTEAAEQAVLFGHWLEQSWSQENYKVEMNWWLH